MKKKVLALALAITTAMSLAGCGGSSGSTASTTAAAASAETAAAAPSNSGAETIKIICPYGVGGTADVIARKYALVAGKTHPEYNFIVENMTGGDGFAAANYYTDQDASTREILVYGYGVAYRHDLGRKYNTEVVDFDRADIYPVATVDDRTWIMYTTSAQTLESILAKAKEGGIKMSGGNPLSDPHLALGSLIAQEGGKVMVVPYDGGAAQKKGLTDGEVDVFVGTTQAALEDVEAGTMIPILAFSESAFEDSKARTATFRFRVSQAMQRLRNLMLPRITPVPFLQQAASWQSAPAQIRHGSMRSFRFPRMYGQMLSTVTGSARSC